MASGELEVASGHLRRNNLFTKAAPVVLLFCWPFAAERQLKIINRKIRSTLYQKRTVTVSETELFLLYPPFYIAANHTLRKGHTISL